MRVIDGLARNGLHGFAGVDVKDPVIFCCGPLGMRSIVG